LGCSGNALKQPGPTEAIVTDRLASHDAPLRAIGAIGKRETGHWLNNRAENSHQPVRRRERAMLRFRRMRSLQKFAALHGSTQNHLDHERHSPAEPNARTDATPRCKRGGRWVPPEQTWG
jgi:putative transposase